MSHQPTALAPGVHWVGAQNPNLRVFDIIMRTEQGTTYNAYLVQGRDKTALIETVKQAFSQEMFDRISAVMPLAKIDYIVCNHLEPDHSGSIPDCVARMRKARVVVSKGGASLLPHLLNRDVQPLAVGTGDKLDLGGKSLEFITAPFLHWPDTMFTYLPEEQILFPCDFFGAHYCHERRFEEEGGDFSENFKYYYDVIMRPFKAYVLKALESIAPLTIRMVAPSHGMILRDVPRYVERYRGWSTEPRPVPGGSLVVFYVSAYGFTRQLAQALAEGARSGGVKAELVDLVEKNPADFLDAIEAAEGLAVGSPTINGDAVKPVWDLLSSLATLKLKGKWAAAFGSYGWSGEAVPMLEERMKSLKFRLAAPGLKVRFTPTPGDLEAAGAMGKEMAAKIKSEIHN